MKYFTHKKRRFRKRKSIKRLSRRKKARMTKKKIVGGWDTPDESLKQLKDLEDLEDNLLSIQNRDMLQENINILFENINQYIKIDEYFYKISSDNGDIGRWRLIGKKSYWGRYLILFAGETEAALLSLIDIRLLSRVKP